MMGSGVISAVMSLSAAWACFDAGQHQRHRLPPEVHVALGQQRLVGHDAANLVAAGNILGNKNAYHAGRYCSSAHIQAVHTPWASGDSYTAA